MEVKKNSKPIMALGFSYKVLCVLIKLLPVRLVNWLVGLLYARENKGYSAAAEPRGGCVLCRAGPAPGKRG